MHSFLNYNMHWGHGNGRGAMDVLRNRLQAAEPQSCHLGQKPEWKGLDNFQTRLLANAFDVPAGKLTQQHADLARQRLDGFEVVARVEDLVTRGADMFQALGWGRHLASHIRTKPNTVHNDRLDFTPQEAQWLRELNHWDIELYNQYAGKPYTSMM